MNSHDFPDAPMIARLRASEAESARLAVVGYRPPPVPKELRDRMDRIAENYPFPQGQP